MPRPKYMNIGQTFKHSPATRENKRKLLEMMRKKRTKTLKLEIAGLLPPAITQTSIIIKYSLAYLYDKNRRRVTKKMPGASDTRAIDFIAEFQ